MDINIDVIKVLEKYDLDLDDLIVLYTRCNSDAKYLNYYSVKKETYEKLIERGFLNNSRGITKLGIEMYREIYDVHIDDSIDDAFEEFWLTYPHTNATDRFPMTRTIRTGNKSRVKAVYLSKLKGDITPEILLRCLKTDIQMRKNISVKENALTFMQIPLNWLSNETYRAFLNSTEYIDKTNISEYGKKLR